MTSEPKGAPPPGVADRLAALRRLYVPETSAEATQRMARERPRARRSFEEAVATRLAELRALSELTRHLHGARRSTAAPRKPR